MKFAKGSKKESSINVQEIKGFTRAYTGTPCTVHALDRGVDGGAKCVRWGQALPLWHD